MCTFIFSGLVVLLTEVAVKTTCVTGWRRQPPDSTRVLSSPLSACVNTCDTSSALIRYSSEASALLCAYLTIAIILPPFRS